MALPRSNQVSAAEALMRRAIQVASQTPTADVPVGCIIIGADGTVLAEATNRRETDHDPTAHAEVLAIRQAVKKLGDSWRLADSTLVVTLEPCAMCAGAIVAARVGRVIFGAYEPKTGACGSVIDVLRDNRVIHRAEVTGGILAPECETLLTQFFTALRNQS